MDVTFGHNGPYSGSDTGQSLMSMNALLIVAFVVFCSRTESVWKGEVFV